MSSPATLDARFLHQQQQILLEQQRRLLVQQQQLAARQQELARRPATPSDAGLSTVSGGGVSGYQMHNIMLSRQQQQQQQQHVSFSGTIGATTPNLMAAEEIRVECVQLTTNGRYVVTGSIYGPPQVWDLKVIRQRCYVVTTLWLALVYVICKHLLHTGAFNSSAETSVAV